MVAPNFLTLPPMTYHHLMVLVDRLKHSGKVPKSIIDLLKDGWDRRTAKALWPIVQTHVDWLEAIVKRRENYKARWARQRQKDSAVLDTECSNDSTSVTIFPNNEIATNSHLALNTECSNDSTCKTKSTPLAFATIPIPLLDTEDCNDSTCTTKLTRVSPIKPQTAQAIKKPAQRMLGTVDLDTPAEVKILPFDPLGNLIKPEYMPTFCRIWEAWPKRSDRKSSRGSKTKALILLNELLSQEHLTCYEAEACAEAYKDYPNVKEGYVKNVTTFFAKKDGLWMEALEHIRRDHMEQEETK